MPAPTLNVLINDQPPGKSKVLLSQDGGFSPSAPDGQKLLVNFARITQSDGSSVPVPKSLDSLFSQHGSFAFDVLRTMHTDASKKTLIVWFLAWKSPTPAKARGAAKLVVTINSTDPGEENTGGGNP